MLKAENQMASLDFMGVQFPNNVLGKYWKEPFNLI